MTEWTSRSAPARSAKLFDPDADALFIVPERVGQDLVFPSFKGNLYRVSDSGKAPKLVEKFSVVEGIDGDLARVLIGPDEEEWFFPVATLPEGVVVGNAVAFVDEGGRYVADGYVGSRQTEDSIEQRLSRSINRRRTAQVDRDDLRRAIDDSAG